MLRKFIFKVIVAALAIYVVATYLPGGLLVSDFGAALKAGLVLILVNETVRPILVFLTLPINFITIGLFTFVINGLMLRLAVMMVSGIELRGSGILAAILISLCISVINFLLPPPQRRKR